MKKEYWFILIAYLTMQLSSFIGIPLTTFIGTRFGQSVDEMRTLSVPIWLVASFTITLVIILWILRKESTTTAYREKANPFSSVIWAITGVFLALFAQGIAAQIEAMMGIKTGSDNTQQIINIIESFPIVIFVSSIVGPILEEIVFRKIIFGALYQRMNFFLSALISSIIFSLAHMELEHTLLYSAMGFTFAYLYVKTKRIIVPIFAHVAMNSLVVVIQTVFKEDIDRIIEQSEKIQSFIGGLL
ncbi:CPBP family intramembrane glutamic endopeptidase [Bacillus sp. T3]|uniref:CPBP family intramembrane glutamic endopeptidase n=1 Tax=Bacillus sp. T3 TaxID=467262 RepID=UPI0029827AA3|nr:CPBP family intramembrane glutamic endopeptidase [Bacillus sp. T3]